MKAFRPPYTIWSAFSTEWAGRRLLNRIRLTAAAITACAAGQELWDVKAADREATAARAKAQAWVHSEAVASATYCHRKLGRASAHES